LAKARLPWRTLALRTTLGIGLMLRQAVAHRRSAGVRHRADQRFGLDTVSS
jgi:hypothetical protein